LLNNAGILGDIPKQSVGTFEGQEFLRIMQTNVLGALLVTEAFRDNVVASSQKKIIGVSSHAGLTSTGGAGFPFYSVSKAALNRALRGMGATIGNGVLVGILLPGAVQTEMLSATPMAGHGLPVDVAVGKMIEAVDQLTPETARKPLTINDRPAEW
jgi:NAD(P)-dependent dehydrogenase (short-subunit alcohol dehydrogenase family)